MTTLPLYTSTRTVMAAPIVASEHINRTVSVANPAGGTFDFGADVLHADLFTPYVPEIGDYFTVDKNGVQAFVPKDEFEAAFVAVPTPAPAGA
jgi:hypothetical protein